MHAGNDGGVAVRSRHETADQQSSDVEKRRVGQHDVVRREAEAQVGGPLPVDEPAVQQLHDFRMAGRAARMHIAGDTVALRCLAGKRQPVVRVGGSGLDQVVRMSRGKGS